VKKPGAETQSVSLSEPGADTVLAGHESHTLERAELALYVLVGQGAQAADPIVLLKVPGAHAAHPTPEFPVYPGSHTQSSRLSLISTEVLCTGHGNRSSVEGYPGQ
jgi:hypothetical protein